VSGAGSERCRCDRGSAVVGGGDKN
jgi:hypothetical protein